MELRPAQVSPFGVAPTRRRITVTVTREGQSTVSQKVVEFLKEDRQLAVPFVTESAQTQNFDPAAVTGVWTVLATDYVEPVVMQAKRITIPPGTDDFNVRLDLTESERPQPGNGYLAGTWPSGVTSIEGVPGPATIRVHYRAEGGAPGDGMLIAETTSNASGVWRIDGLNENLKYDVICRADGYNDMILSNVSPAVD